jgi:hypothetical protein
VTAPRQQYDSQFILMSINCALAGSAGFRCIARTFMIIANSFSFFECPHFNTIRSWVLRIGLYMLERVKEKEDWIYIMDASIQMGSMKCLLILGIRRKCLEDKGHYVPSYQDVEPLAIRTVESCNAKVVQEALLEAEAKTGTPHAVISDEGKEMIKGVSLWNGDKKKVIHHFDVTHKVDLILKKEIEGDQEWHEFTKQMTATVQQLKLTSSAHLIPPKQRQKRRMLGEVQIVKWANNILKFLDRGGKEEKVEWLKKYRQFIFEYRQMTVLCELAIHTVRQQGYHRHSHIMFDRQASQVLLTTPRAEKMGSKLKEFLKEEGSKVPDKMTLPGTSEIIESVFGSFKQLEKQHSSGGLTSLILALAALVGKKHTDLVNDALECVPVKKVKEWIKNNLGTTFWSKRRKDLGKGATQKRVYLERDEFPESA